jgi:hypothetical protein
MNYQEFCLLRVKDPIFLSLNITEKGEDWEDFKRDHSCTWCGTDKVVSEKTGLISCLTCSGETLQKDDETKELAARANTPKLDFLEAAKIAKEAISNFPLDELYELIDFLDGKTEINKTIALMHGRIKPIYRELITASYQKNGVASLEAIDADIRQAMDRGMKALLRNETVSPLLGDKKVLTRSADNQTIYGEKIKNTHSWNELKNKFPSG